MNDIVEAARACLGARFRPQGRNPAYGLDCVGLAAFVLRSVGIESDPPADYRLRDGDDGRLADALDALPLRRVAPNEALAGDLLLTMPVRGQRHLVVLSDIGFIHAHLGLGRVVETPGWPDDPVVGAWRA